MSEQGPSVPGRLSAGQAAAIVEIQQKIYYYGWCIDHRDFDALDALFLPDAVVHYDVEDGTRAPWREMKQWLPEGLEIFRATQHNMSNPMVEIDGDRARSRTYGLLVHFQELTDGSISVMRHHGIYHDDWQLHDGEWRIAGRRLANLYVDGPVLRGERVVTHRVARPL